MEHSSGNLPQRVVYGGFKEFVEKFERKKRQQYLRLYGRATLILILIELIMMVTYEGLRSYEHSEWTNGIKISINEVKIKFYWIS